MFSKVRQALDSLAVALDHVDAAPTGELRDALGLAKPLRAKLETLETAVASQIAQRERHGDGGAGVLHQIAAVPRSDAARNVRTAAELEQVPAAQSALTHGEMSMANAARLARAARDTSPEAVQGDADLVNLAKTLPPDEFAHASKRWTAQHQSAADLAERHRRNRRNRNVRFWNGEDGTVQMRGSFDAEMGARIQARIRDEAERLRQADRRLMRTRPAANTDDSALRDAARSSSTGDGAVRTRDQRMADALDRILTHAAPTPATARDTASGDTAAGDKMPGSTDSGGTVSVGHRGPSTEIIVRADLGDLLDECGGMGEIAGAGPVPASVIDRLSCNADISVVLFGKQLTPLYEAAAGRAPTAAQRRALIARDGACIGCGAVPTDCQAHHIVPWKCGGATRVDNLVLVCWSCHDRIHDHNWQVVVRDGRYRLVPPDASSPPNPAPSRKPVLFA